MGFAFRGDTMTDSILIDVKQLAAMVDLSQRTVWRLANAGWMPAPLKLGGSQRWRKAEVSEWIAQGCKPLQQVRGR